jgi:indole-3-pyruvate monooxygenase
MNPEYKNHSDINTLIIGASISGLSCAASLQKHDIEYIVIERENMIAAPWHHHYDRLHLHTSKRFSHLPYKKFGRIISRYPSRRQVIEYLNDYQRTFHIKPIFNTEALLVKREGNQWITETNNGIYTSRFLIMATGPYAKPKAIGFKEIASFSGRILHSCQYKTGRDFKNQKVLVVGFGNSASEIAIDLYEHGAAPSMSVRSPVNVIPRDILGVPVQELSILLSPLPPKLADIISKPLINLTLGDLSKTGLQQKSYGPLEQIRRDAKAPVLDIGTMQLIRQGDIRVFGDIDFIDDSKVHFKSGQQENFDAIIAGIGYDPDYSILQDIR